MKQFFVARDGRYNMPEIVFNTDSREDAGLYADIMQRNEEKEYEYFVLALDKE